MASGSEIDLVRDDKDVGENFPQPALSVQGAIECTADTYINVHSMDGHN